MKPFYVGMARPERFELPIGQGVSRQASDE